MLTAIRIITDCIVATFAIWNITFVIHVAKRGNVRMIKCFAISACILLVSALVQLALGNLFNAACCAACILAYIWAIWLAPR